MKALNTVRSEKVWMTSYIEYELHKHLITVPDKDGVTKLYVSQAEHLFARIPTCCRPIPSFEIYMEDLTPELETQLAYLDKSTRNCVVKEAVGRIFEKINLKLYLYTVRNKLKCRFVSRNDPVAYKKVGEF